MQELEGIKVKCDNPDCGYTWKYKPRTHRHLWVTCPSCRKNLKVRGGQR